ncbi:hypothetical protein CYMTET_24686 [Cymbomonas tetramitiformis]|uniref:Lysosomal dipeptide transporter MFSD1 n=1 Tax=Cymbomonas tetramitiformis TaxID=36881 RepID=A0AAE0FVU4_9CHLO|nr:hypothetical protein CYMTET_24686 [Cymbomonas tetramitiformis]
MIFSNHYSRDCVGALEKQMEAEYGFSEVQDGYLNAVYFFPSTIFPAIAGVISQKVGISKTLITFLLVASTGQIVFGLGSSLGSYPLLLVGRILQGLVWGLCAWKVDSTLKRENNGTSSAQIETPEDIHSHQEQEPFKDSPTLNKLPRQYWVFVLCGALMYGGIVPIMFIGSNIFQEEWGLSVSESDRLLLLPELPFLVSPALGVVVDKHKMVLGSRMWLLAVGQALCITAYLTLALAHSSPYGPMICLGFGGTVSSTMLWNSLHLVCPQPLLPVGSGILGTAINIFPSVLPPAMAYTGNYAIKLGLLALLGALSAIVAVIIVLLERMKLPTKSGSYQRVPLASSDMDPILEENMHTFYATFKV